MGQLRVIVRVVCYFMFYVLACFRHSLSWASGRPDISWKIFPCTDLRYVDVGEGCPYYQKEEITWTAHKGIRFYGGKNHVASNLDGCKAACAFDPSCNGLDWHPQQVRGPCWLHGPSWSSHPDGKHYPHDEVTHYDLQHTCVSIGTLTVYFAMHYRAKRGLEIACRLSICLSVRPSVCL